jgi:hypothetical protein
MNNTLSTTAFEQDIGRRLDIAKRCAEKGNPGEVFFHEASSNPLISMFITTGELIDGSDDTHETYIMMECQHAGYPLRINDFTEIIRKGYDMFCVKYPQETGTATGVGRTLYSYEEYAKMFRKMCRIIDAAIYSTHGIECFADGDVTNRDHENMYYLHICDIMNVMVHEAANKQINLLITSLSLPYITQEMKHIFQERLINSRQCFFLMSNVDIFYMLYGYYKNNSFMAIRTKMVRRTTVFKESSVLMNDDHFVNHQRGKLKEIEQSELDVITRMLYRTI